MSSDPRTDIPRRRFSAWAIRLGTIAATVVVLLVLLGLLLLPGMRKQYDGNRRAIAMNDLRIIGMALYSYQNKYGSYPPAYVADANGKPMHSWRVLVLPFFGEAQYTQLYEKYDFGEPWDGPHNRQLAEQTPEFFLFTDSRDKKETNFLAVVGRETGWPAPRPMRLERIADMPGNTIQLVEAAHSGIHWMEPRDMTLEQAMQGINTRENGPYMSSVHSKGACALWFDLHVTELRDDTRPDTLRALLTAAGDEDVKLPDN